MEVHWFGEERGVRNAEAEEQKRVLRRQRGGRVAVGKVATKAEDEFPK